MGEINSATNPTSMLNLLVESTGLAVQIGRFHFFFFFGEMIFFISLVSNLLSILPTADSHVPKSLSPYHQPKVAILRSPLTKR